MNNLDDLFKNKLEHNGLEFQEEYWNEMEELIDSDNKKKRRFVLFFSGLFVILIGCVMGLLYSGNNENHAVLFSTPAASSETNTNTRNNPDNKAILENKLDNVDKNKPSTSDKPTQKTKPSQHAGISETKQTEFNTNTQSKKPISILTASTESRANNRMDWSNGIETDDKDHLLFVDFIKLSTSKIVLEQILPHTCKNYAHGLKLDPIKPKEKVNWVYQIGLHSLYNLNSRSSLNTNNENSKNSFGYLASFSASKKHWGFTTGLEYYKYQEQNNYKNTTKSYTFDTSYYMVNAMYASTPKGTRIALISRRIDTLESQRLQTVNTSLGLQYINIPLHVFYATKLGKISLQFEAGLNAGFLIGKTGTYTHLIQGNYVVQTAKGSNAISPFLSQTYIGLGCSYPIYKQFSLQGNINVLKGMGAFMPGGSSTLNRKGFGLGVVYRLR
jgi:cytoskeletal protein RodZ